MEEAVVGAAGALVICIGGSPVISCRCEGASPWWPRMGPIGANPGAVRVCGRGPRRQHRHIRPAAGMSPGGARFLLRNQNLLHLVFKWRLNTKHSGQIRATQVLFDAQKGAPKRQQKQPPAGAAAAYPRTFHRLSTSFSTVSPPTDGSGRVAHLRQRFSSGSNGRFVMHRSSRRLPVDRVRCSNSNAAAAAAVALGRRRATAGGAAKGAPGDVHGSVQGHAARAATRAGGRAAFSPGAA